MTIPYIDIHTHHPVYSKGIISVPSLFLQDVDTNHQLTYPFSTGIHPWHADKFSLNDIAKKLEYLMSQPELIAIGETGLDNKCQIDFDLQGSVFKLHIEFAEKFHKPLIIHNVNSWNEIIACSKKSNVPFILHAFNGNIELTRQLIHHGFNFSIGKAILKENIKLRDAIKIIPVTSLFFETDDEILDIKEIYYSAASILKCSVENLKIQILSNYNRAFQIP
jgi:TatD DNase family protein